MQRYLTFGYTALIVGGVVLAAGGAMYIATWTTPFSAEAQTTGFVAASALRLVGMVGVMIGVTALCVRQSGRSGRLGLVALVGVTAWTALWVGSVFTDLFVSGALATADPGVLDGSVPNDRLSLGFLLAYASMLALVLLGVATLRAHVFSRAVGWVLVGTGLLALVPLPISLPVTDLELGVLLAVSGALARQVAPVDEVVVPAPDVRAPV